MGRRGFLETLASLGVSATVVNGLSKEMFEQLVDDPQTEVPSVFGHIHTNHEEMNKGAALEREPIYYTVSRDRWRRVEGVHDARDRVAELLVGRSEPLDIWVTTNSNGEKQVDVDVYETDSVDKADIRDVEDELPATIDGVAGRGTAAEDVLEDVPIVVGRTPVPAPKPAPLGSGPDHYWSDWDEVPGGSACYIGKDTQTITWGSLCAPVDDDSTPRMVTAGHLVDEQDREWVSATEPEGIEDFEIDQIGCMGGTGLDVFDAATLNPESSVEMTHEFAGDSGEVRGDVRGVVDEEHLRYIEDDGPDQDVRFMRQGARTGVNSEFGIDKIGENGFITTLLKDKTKGGDSGGPYYLRDSNLDGDKFVTEADVERLPTPYDLVAGVHQGDDTDEPHTVATSMYRVEEEFDVKV